jgi:hypothetical protein
MNARAAMMNGGGDQAERNRRSQLGFAKSFRLEALTDA